MLKFEEICELVRLVGSSGVTGVEIEQGGTRVRVEGRPQPQVVVSGGTPHLPVGESIPAAVPVSSSAHDAPAVAAEDDGHHIVSSPIVGTFYRAPNPDAEPFVKVGDVVRAGQVLCIVEAMKLMNEIESDIDGTVVKVHVDNAEPVEYGQNLFSISPS